METTGILSGMPSLKPAHRQPVTQETSSSNTSVPGEAASIDPTARPLASAVSASSSAQFDLSGEQRREEQAKKLEEAVEGANKFFQSLSRTLQFNLNNDYGRLLVQIKDSESGDLVRQIPSEEMLELARRLDELNGLLFKEKA